jgi:putative sterol carrier protein
MMADINEIEAALRARMEGRKPIGKTIKFDLKGDGFLFIDGVSNPPTIAQEDGKADATITISIDDLVGLVDGSLQGQSLMMTGRAKMSGNPMVAMKLGELLLP